jgi:hypothetical protein
MGFEILNKEFRVRFLHGSWGVSEFECMELGVYGTGVYGI